MDRVRLREKTHSAYIRDNILTVEWYDFGEDAPYESTNMIHFEGPARAALAHSLGLAEDAADPALLACIQTRFHPGSR